MTILPNAEISYHFVTRVHQCDLNSPDLVIAPLLYQPEVKQAIHAFQEIGLPADLTPYQNTDNYWDNITGLSISYPPIKNCVNFKLIAHHYRHRDSTLPTILKNKQARIPNTIAKPNISQDPNFWLTVMQTIHDSFISSRPMDMILKILHDALYMGETSTHIVIYGYRLG